MAKAPKPKPKAPKGKGGRTSTLALLGWGAGMLALGLGAGLLLSQQGCDRKPQPRKPHRLEELEPAPPKPARPEAAPKPHSSRPEPAPLAPPKAPERLPDKVEKMDAALPRLAIVIDDLGYAQPELVTRLVAQPVPLTVAVLPYQEFTAESAEIAYKAGKEVILHLPMEGRAEKDPGPDALKYDLPEAELRARTRKALKAVPYITGANNHMGSRLTEDRARMGWVLDEFKGRRLFFLDSRTTKDTVAWQVAQQLGIPTGQRNVFLDDDKSFEEIKKQWERAVALAKKDGSAIAIGHIYPETVAALEQFIPAAKGQVTLVRVSALLK